MAVDVDGIRARFPEFSDKSDYPNPRIEIFIGDAVLIYMGTDELRWGGKYDIAQSYLVAHLIAMAENTELGDVTATSGPAQSKSAGGVSISYGTYDEIGAGSFFESTSYGKQFVNIASICFGLIMSTGKI